MGPYYLIYNSVFRYYIALQWSLSLVDLFMRLLYSISGVILSSLHASQIEQNDYSFPSVYWRAITKKLGYVTDFSRDVYNLIEHNSDVLKNEEETK